MKTPIPLFDLSPGVLSPAFLLSCASALLLALPGPAQHQMSFQEMQQALDQVQNDQSSPGVLSRQSMPQSGYVSSNPGMPPQTMPPMNSGMPPQMMPPANSGIPQQMMSPMNSGMPPQMMPPMNSGMPPQMMPPMNSGAPEQIMYMSSHQPPNMPLQMMPPVNSGAPPPMMAQANFSNNNFTNGMTASMNMQSGFAPGQFQNMNGQRPRGIFGLLRMANSYGTTSYNPNDLQAQAKKQSAIEAVRYELGVSKSMASQAVAYMDRARYAHYKDEKQSAAYEARYYANEARTAAERAESRGSGISEAQGMVSSAWAEADRAKSASDYANDAADDW